MNAERVPLIQWTHGLVNRLVMLVDVAAVMAGVAFAWKPVRAVPGVLTAGQALVIGLLAAMCFVTVARRVGAYRVERYRRLPSVLLDIAVGMSAASLFCGLIFYTFVPNTDIGLLTLGWAGRVTLLLIVARLGVALGVGAVRRVGLLRRKVIVVGSSPLTDVMAARLTVPGMFPQYDLRGVYPLSFDLRQASMTPLAVEAKLAELGRYAQSNAVDPIVVCLPWDAVEERKQILDRVQWIAADVVTPFEMEESFAPNTQITRVAGLQALLVMHRPFKGTLGLLKIAEDYLIASLALVLASPILLLAALAIRIDSPGPILFRQVRIGFNNKPFMICKFRTMAGDPGDDGAIGTQGRNDPRITRVGAILRRLSIDELPQLLNVFTGDMSVVGPRPYVPNMLVGETRFNESVQQFAARHRIKPGITGWAQVNGLRGSAVRTIEGARRSVAFDIHYLTHWSVWFDLRIMARTVVALSGRHVF